MKILAIAGSRVPSDTANSIQVMKACSALAGLGHDLTLIVPDFELRPSTFDIRSQYGIETSFPMEWLGGSSRRLFTFNAVRAALKHKPDLLYVWLPQSAVFGLLARLPTIFEIHIQPSGWFGPAWHRAFAKLPGRKRLACITNAMKNLLATKYSMRMRDADVVIAPNGVELERFASLPDPERARQSLGWSESPTVLCAGHLYAGRGADLFLQLAESTQQANFIWVGGRPHDVEEWGEKAKTRGLGNVNFIGFVPNFELPNYLAAADVLIMPYAKSIYGSSGSADSASVASPMKMFEYMAAGRAILTSDLPVIREVLDEASAVFVPPQDASAWTSALKSLLDDSQKRIALAQNARRRVENYTWTARARKILNGF
ncbi:MAG: D-inositol-3-phosphate glycosyltransferase [Anaerolineales bacterium]|nr:D-inositol-3-phosphate glycosyltransferase [Anaerolineales bacterium]